MKNINPGINLSRRNFIKLTAVAGGVLAGGQLLSDLMNLEQVTVNETRLLMGTIINLKVISKTRSAGEEVIAGTFAELERQVEIFNFREVESPVSILNRTGKLENPPKELVEVLNAAIAISEITDGAFDVTVKPLVDLFQQTQPGLPSEAAVQAATRTVDFRKLVVSDAEISFRSPNMALTLDGIAKGYIVDAGVGVLKRSGYENVYVEAGGDLMAAGRKAEDLPWKIGVQSPRESQPDLLAQFNVSDQAVATSGDYHHYYTEDRRYHHIIDPRVGYSNSELASVTIISSNAMEADALATAVMVLGQEKGLELIDSLLEVNGYLITKDLELLNPF